MSQPDKPLSYSFPPLARTHATILILGSMPGIASLDAQQYYAHPRNAFWPIMASLFDVDLNASYQQRCQQLSDAGVAVWDVLKACYRPGSLDQHIDPATIEANDFSLFFHQHKQIQAVFFNGGKAESLFKRYVLADLPPIWQQLPQIRLPSTSPAHAALSFEQKVQQWRPLLTT